MHKVIFFAGMVSVLLVVILFIFYKAQKPTEEIVFKDAIYQLFIGSESHPDSGLPYTVYQVKYCKVNECRQVADYHFPRPAQTTPHNAIFIIKEDTLFLRIAGELFPLE